MGFTFLYLILLLLDYVSKLLDCLILKNIFW